MSTVVLDAWAALAFLRREGQAWVMMRRLLRRSVRGNVRLVMNVVNLGEVYYRLVQTAGKDLQFIQDQLGHHSPEFTLSVYGHLLPRDRRDEVNCLDDAAPIRNPAATSTPNDGLREKEKAL